MAGILVTGANGLLGATLVPTLRDYGYAVVGLSRNGPDDINADLRNFEQTNEALSKVAPDVIVNLTGLTNVDECESAPDDAYATNTLTVENVVRWLDAQDRGCHLVQISTDQVYSGVGPHAEEGVRPVNYYALSKYAGELIAGRTRSTILRINMFGRSRHPDRATISDWIVAAIRRREKITVFDDVFFSPLSLGTLSKMIAMVVERRITGTFNLGANSGMSKAQFAFELAACLELPRDTLMKDSCSVVSLVARRPRDMRMCCRRFESHFGIVLPSLREEIRGIREVYES